MLKQVESKVRMEDQGVTDLYKPACGKLLSKLFYAQFPEHHNLLSPSLFVCVPPPSLCFFPFYCPHLTYTLLDINRLKTTSPLPFSSSAVFFFCSPREKQDESTGVEGVSKVGEKQSDKESRTGEDHCTDSNGSDVSDELVSLVTAWASFVKRSAGWY